MSGKDDAAQPGSVAVVGLGYVGLPLAVEFGKYGPTLGYDRSRPRIDAIRAGNDPTGETVPEALRAATHLQVSDDPAIMAGAADIIVAVPTPVDRANKPDFGPLESASESVGRHMRRGATVVYESTVYPGATEEVCVPILERASGMVWKRDFHVGYSPERINPGDREHTLTRIVKVVAGDTPETLERVAALYSRVVTAGVYRAGSIAVAEAAKVIENTQRDLNIALMNELAIIFDRMGLDTAQVLAAAGTKWNFLPFRPGLVGGHCIGVDPYYLTHKAEMIGYHPEVILAGRRINDGMAKMVADRTIKLLAAAGTPIKGATMNVLGLTFKENVSDLRNSKVADLCAELASYGTVVRVHDPLADAGEAKHEYGITLSGWDELPAADALVLAVGHSEYLKQPLASLLSRCKPGGCVVDIKSCLEPDAVRAGGRSLWRL